MRKQRTPARVVRLLDALVVIPAIGVLLILVPLALTDRAGCRHPARQPKDSSQIRAILQANSLWAERGATRGPGDSDAPSNQRLNNDAPPSP